MVIVPSHKGVVHRHIFTRNQAWGGEHHRRVIRNILCNYAVRTNAHVVAYVDTADDLGTRSNVHIITDRGSTGVLCIGECIGTNCYLVKDDTAFTDFCTA